MTAITHYQVTAELMTDDKGPLISLEQQDGMNDPTTVYVHPWQLRKILEQFGVIAADKDSAKTIATLERRLLVLQERIETLHDYLCNNSDHKHADLTWEVTYATATLDVANEFCHDLDAPVPDAPGSETTTAPKCNPVPDDAGKQNPVNY